MREGGKVSLSSRFARDPLIGVSIRESKSRATFSSARTVRPEKRKKKKERRNKKGEKEGDKIRKGDEKGSE